MVAKEGRSHSRPRSPSVTECAPLAVLVVTRFGDDPYPTLRKAAALLHSLVRNHVPRMVGNPHLLPPQRPGPDPDQGRD